MTPHRPPGRADPSSAGRPNSTVSQRPRRRWPTPIAIGAAAWALAAADHGPLPDLAGVRPVADLLTREATNSMLGYERLVFWCDRFGPRFTGSTNLEAALDWALDQLRKDGLEQVRGEPVSVPRWVRGPESLELIEPRPEKLRLLSLGPSVPTPPEGLTASVLVVSGIEDLQRRGAEARGRIIVFNQPFTTYTETRLIRSRGAIEAARAGGVASLIRSVTPFSLRTPHTGMMRYADDVPRVPHAAIPVEDALLLERFQARGDPLRLRLRIAAQTYPDVVSRNVIAEWRGRERPEEVVVVGAHSDSWDIGQGAHDDAGGCFAAWEAIRLIKQANLRPRRTLRLVLWVNEENGLRGARAYAARYQETLTNHVLAIESDLGVFAPTGFSMAGGERSRRWTAAVAALVEGLGAARLTPGSGGADTQPLVEQGVPALELLTQSDRYFWYHHTEADTVDKVNPAEFNRCVAALAVLAYAVAELPERLPR